MSSNTLRIFTAVLLFSAKIEDCVVIACFILYIIDKKWVHDDRAWSNTDTLAYSWITYRYIYLDQWCTKNMNNGLFLFVQDLVAVEFSSSCGLA